MDVPGLADVAQATCAFGHAKIVALGCRASVRTVLGLRGTLDLARFVFT